ncbi:MAG: ADP-ribosylglycohydrolase family protein [Candidatus Thermochlorobacter aerophilum]|jgi:ADP-ribosylglycohydrolase|uniref:ADP-ribosylglycohydrolase family protein n=1 Tax=Candidatus Thermochlorobacter aerophilus TaxID=1868324 RepID=A0A395LYU3_9BACT|nr:MAG: ADP-ribosylglycohydrolase family protein [Candidatus Thermochlorobacter aerophilum]
MNESKLRGFLLGALIGDALGLPVHKKPHHIIRMYFKGIKDYTDEYYSTGSPTGLRAGQNSIDARPILQALPHTDDAAIETFTEKFFQVQPDTAVQLCKFFKIVKAATLPLVPQQILAELFETQEQQKILSAMSFFPNDMVIEFDEAMDELNAVRFALAMFLRSHDDFETTVLSTVNMGGLARLTGAIVGGAMGLLHGHEAIPKHLVQGLEHSLEIVEKIEAIFGSS